MMLVSRSIYFHESSSKGTKGTRTSHACKRFDLSLFHLDRTGRRQKGQIAFHCVRRSTKDSTFPLCFEVSKSDILVVANCQLLSLPVVRLNEALAREIMSEEAKKEEESLQATKTKATVEDDEESFTTDEPLGAVTADAASEKAPNDAPVQETTPNEAATEVAASDGGPETDAMLEACPYREDEEPQDDLHLPAGPPMSPPTYDIIDETSRRDIHSKLRAYEHRRRTAYSTKLESSSLYWRSFRDLLRASVHETARAERMVLGTAIANKIYAESMQASYEDAFLDDRGGMVNDPKKQKKLLDIRSSLPYDMAPINKNEDGKRLTVKVPEQRKTNMLHNLIESQQEIATKFGENAQTLSAEIATEISDLRKALAVKVMEIQQLGDTIIGELEKTELEVTQAWGECVCYLFEFSPYFRSCLLNTSLVFYRGLLCHGDEIDERIQYFNRSATPRWCY